MIEREKILEMVNLALDIQDLGEGVNGFLYVCIEASNYGFPISLAISNNGFVEGEKFGRYYLIQRKDETKIDDCILVLKKLLEKAKGMVSV